VRTSRTFPHELVAVREARHFARAAVKGLPGDVVDAVELMVSELATNSVKHATSPFELLIDRGAKQIRVEVTDTGRGEPIARDPAPSDPTGRGLLIVDLMSDEWGVRRKGEAKTVWFLLHIDRSGDGEGAAGETTRSSTGRKARGRADQTNRGRRVAVPTDRDGGQPGRDTGGLLGSADLDRGQPRRSAPPPRCALPRRRRNRGFDVPSLSRRDAIPRRTPR
jgi:anti-sigma regulatory factor (Ser/Thr protein kinase)